MRTLKCLQKTKNIQKKDKLIVFIDFLRAL